MTRKTFGSSAYNNIAKPKLANRTLEIVWNLCFAHQRAGGLSSAIGRYAEPRWERVLNARVIGFREVDRTLNIFEATHLLNVEA